QTDANDPKLTSKHSTPRQGTDSLYSGCWPASVHVVIWGKRRGESLRCCRATMISPGGTRLPSGGSKMVPVPLRFRQTTRNIGSLINFFSNQLEEHRNDRASARFHFMKYPILPI